MNDADESGLTENNMGSAGYEKIPPDLPPTPVKVPAQGSRRRAFFRSCLIWITGLLGIFALGIAATWIVQVRPRMDKITELEQERDAQQVQIMELQATIQACESLEEEVEELSSSLNETKVQLLLTLVVSDVASARIALDDEDPVAATTALAGTSKKIEEMKSFPHVIDPDTLDGFQTRLDLILNEIESDEFAARSDLTVLASNLALLEKSLYGD